MTTPTSESVPPILMRKLNRRRLQSAPPPELAMLFAAGHVCNEINALLRVAVWATLGSSQETPTKEARAFLTNFFLTLLAGKLTEAYNVIQKAYFGSVLSKKYSKRLNPEASSALDRLNRYFSSTNNVHKIRNYFAFHYSPERLADALPYIEGDLVLYMQKGHAANNLFAFAEEAATQALFREMAIQDNAQGVPALMGELTSTAKQFVIFFDGLMDAILRDLGKPVWGPKAQPIHLPNLVPFDSVSIPYFIDVSAMLSREP